MQLVKRELARLLDDHSRCPDFLIKREIEIDIQLLKEAISIFEEQQNSFHQKET
ncbi:MULTISPECIES: hypothetical protein [Bacillaceae]|uniref:hypothetical protein n=1 Tax=Bacillaceae TaxID=186817 RepID=UPI001E484E15|nr:MULTISPECIES: hypothetical protein [Bacillaceae]MCE4049766.1 hypothetical protein [Bacillus sp. Au-Bac7]MCM3032309.1 hypothetical protein [Niallia sp. MER 6]MDL0435335.1 hypothetical protein [Niallia sp. SS-2023]UPO87530.1 hypothetical protein L8T27_018560 [Niallia sp. Man26]